LDDKLKIAEGTNDLSTQRSLAMKIQSKNQLLLLLQKPLAGANWFEELDFVVIDESDLVMF
jgi:hypothetical protein